MPVRDARTRRLEEQAKCDTCGQNATIPRGVMSTRCELCKRRIHRVREFSPRDFDHNPGDRSVFDIPHGRLPYRWLLRRFFANLYRFSTTRFLDLASLLGAVGTAAVTGAVAFWKHGAEKLGVWQTTLVFWSSVACIAIVLTDFAFVPLRRRTAAPLRRIDPKTRLDLPRSWAAWTPLMFAPQALAIVILTAFGAVLTYGDLPIFLVRLVGAAALVATSLWLTVRLMHWAYGTLTPEEYAQTTLGGRRADDVFKWVSWDMYHLCYAFLQFESPRLKLARRRLIDRGRAEEKDSRKLKKSIRNSTMMQALLTVWGSYLGPERVSEDIASLERRMLALRMTVRRCLAMKQLTATEFGIQERLLCDHLFRFSPTIHERRVSKYVRNWRTIATALTNYSKNLAVKKARADQPASARTMRDAKHPGVPWRRILDLLEENERIASRIRRRANYLRILVTSSDLFEDARVFASPTSLRESITAYTSAVASLAAGPYSDDELRARLTVLYLMQKTHPGADVHLALEKLASGAVRWCLRRKRAHLSRIAVLKKLAAERQQDSSMLEKRAWRSLRKSEALADYAKQWSVATRALRTLRRRGEKGPPLSPEHVEQLTQLVPMVTAALHNTQWDLNRWFEMYLTRWLGPHRRALLLTYGNSRGVRDALKCAAMHILEPSDRIFVGRGTDHELSARVMSFDLREDHRWHRSGETPELGQGDVDLLVNLVQDQDDLGVLVVLGAEMFDRHGRFVQIADALSEVQRLRDVFQAIGASRRLRVVVVAESYKRFDDLLTEQELFRDHLDRIALFPAGIADHIIGDAGIFRPPRNPRALLPLLANPPRTAAQAP